MAHAERGALPLEIFIHNISHRDMVLAVCSRADAAVIHRSPWLLAAAQRYNTM